MLRAAQPHPLSAVLARLDRVARIVGVGPHLEAAELVGPLENRAGGTVLVERLRLDRRHVADIHLAGGAVDGDLLALFDRRPVRGKHSLADVDVDRARADDARPAHPARDERSVAGCTSGLREDAFRLDHSVHVVGVGLDADQDHGLAGLAPLHRGVGVENGPARSGAR